MAVIQSIRNRYGKIAGGVIGVALISFIISDARNGSFGRLFGNSTNVMTVNGTKIDAKEYQQRVKEYETLTQIYSSRGPLDDAARAQISEQVLQSIAFETVAEEICDKMGIIVSEQEKKDMIYGPNAHQLIRQFSFQGQQIFNNPETKQFDPARVKGIEDQLTKDPKQDPGGQIMEGFRAVKSYVLRMARIDKLNTMMSAGAYAPMYTAKRSVMDNMQKASIRFVKVPFATIPDDQVKVSDDDIKAYMQKHKAMFETEQASRAIEYVSFDVIPSSADSARTLGALEEMKAEFASTKDDKTFVGSKTEDNNPYNGAYVSSKNFGSRYADTIMKQATGSVFGPYFDNGAYHISKMIDRKSLPDSVKFRQIVVFITDGKNTAMTDSAAKIKIDSIANALKAGASFDTLFARYNPQNAQQNPKGEIPVTLQAMPQLQEQLNKEFTDFIYEGHAGEKKIIKINNEKTNGYQAYHYVDIIEQTGMGPVAQIATITKSLYPSDSTSDAIFARANEFASKSTDAATFDATAKKMGVDKRVGDNLRESSFTIQGLGPARDVVKWAYNHKVGEVAKDPFRLSDQRYVVAKLVSINEKGLAPVTAMNRPMFEQRIRDEKKADMIAAKYKGAALEAIATGVGATVAQSDSVILGGAMLPGLGYEPKVVGYTFSPSLQPNTVSPGIKGQGGVYFISVLSKGTVPAPDAMQQQMMLMQARQQEEYQLRGYLGQMLQPMMTRKAEIKYNIDNF